jgi:capsular polysaccharide biosynthesis protein
VDFGDFTRLILRRKFIALPLLLLTIIASVALIAVVKPAYVLTSYVQLVPSTDAGGAGDNNPWNNLGVNALSQAAMYATEDQTFLQSLPAQGAASDIAIDVGYPNPVITFTITGNSPEQAKKTTDLIVARYTAQTQALQDQFNVHTIDLITTQRLDQGENLTTSNGKRYRDAVLAFAFGILLTLGLTIGIDARARRKVSAAADAVRIAATPATSVRGQASNGYRPTGDAPTVAGIRVPTVEGQSEHAPASDATVVMTLPKWSAAKESGEPS